MDEGERGDDEDDAGRCRSDARGQPSTAFVAAELVGGTVARAGVDIAREREKRFRECPAFVTALNGSRRGRARSRVTILTVSRSCIGGATRENVVGGAGPGPSELSVCLSVHTC